MKRKVHNIIIVGWLLGIVACTPEPEFKYYPKLELLVPIEYEALEKQNISCTFTLKETQQCVMADGKATIKLRGNSTAEFPKKPFQIKLSEDRAICGMSEAKKWILLANYFDKTMLRNALAFRMSESSRLKWTPHYSFVEVYYNGAQKGTYQLTEKVEVHSNRVVVPQNGWLIEIDARVTDKDHYFETHRMENPYRIEWPHKNITEEQVEQIHSYFLQVEDVLFGENFADKEDGWRKYLDEDSWVDWYLINEIAKNGDGNFYSSCYMHLDTCGKIAMGPIWDYDTCFGNNIFEVPRNPEGFYVRDSQWYTRLMADTLFAQHVRERFTYFYDNKGQYYNFLHQKALQLSPNIENNDQIWHTIGVSISPYISPCATYEEELDYLIYWQEKRYEWLKNNL